MGRSVDGRHRPIPVSYTHLDVYKRQGQTRCLNAGSENREIARSDRRIGDVLRGCCMVPGGIASRNGLRLVHILNLKTYSQREFAGQLSSYSAEGTEYAPYVEHVRLIMKRSSTSIACSFDLAMSVTHATGFCGGFLDDRIVVHQIDGATMQ